MKLEAAVEELHDAEIDLAQALEAAADRHALDADMHLHCRTLATHARNRAALLVGHGERLGTDLDAEHRPGAVAKALGTMREAAGTILGRKEQAGALLLHDLRHLHRVASEVEVAWWIVRQGALVHRDTELYELFDPCHEETWNELRWLKTKIKETAPQVLSG